MRPEPGHLKGGPLVLRRPEGGCAERGGGAVRPEGVAQEFAAQKHQVGLTAADHFVGVVQEITGCSRDQGFMALNTMLKLKVIKLDVGGGRYRVKHGAFMEASALRAAINY